MKLPRDVSGARLVKSQHHVTIPNHDHLRIGTLAAILADVGAHHGLSREASIEKLFG